jgi:NAD(P)-dependent dehydrogenase (short-subunit alcohol dehydrogenase family)
MHWMNVDLAGDVAVVTGAGRRLGRLYALGFARAGAKVVVNDVDASAAARVVDEIEAAGGNAVAAIASVSDPAGAASIVETAVGHFGTVDVVVNNAGFMRSAYVAGLTPEKLQDVLDVHINGSFHVSQAAWPVMRDKGYGRIVMTSSGLAMFPMPATANYAAAKAGVYGLTRAFALEGAPVGIQVNALLPHANPLDDDNALMSQDESQRWTDSNWGTPAVESYLQPSFLELAHRRDPALVTPLVLYLASRACEVTGEAFAVGMGRYARVFVSEGRGWRQPGDEAPSAEEVGANIERIMSTEGAIVPRDLLEEHAFLGRTET